MSFSLGACGAGAFGPGRFSQTRGRVQGSLTQGVNYPSPFFDVAHTYLPTTVKQLFRYCRYYFMTNPLVNATVFKLAEYPVTDIIIDHENPKVKRRWMEYFHDHLQYRAFQVESGLDYFCYGNGMNSVSFPFQKYLTCAACGWTERADKTRRFWTFTNLEFRLQCPRCGHNGTATPRDHYYRNASGIRLLRWNVEDVEINYNDISGESTYFYTVPGPLRNDILIGKKDVVQDVPQIFIQAIKQRKGVVFSKDNLFHLKRPTLAWQDRGWGTPLILPVLKDTFYLQIMKKAQECVAPSTLLETSKGLLPASNVSVGDFVRSHTGHLRRVTATKVRPMVEERGDYAVELILSGLRQLPSIFSDNHPLWVLRRNEKNRRKDTPEMRRSSYVIRNPELYEFQWVDAGDVKVGDYIGYPTTRCHEQMNVDVGSYVDFVKTSEYVYSGVGESTALAFEAIEEGERVKHDGPGRVAKRHARNGTAPKRFKRNLPLTPELGYIIGWYLGDGSYGARRLDFSMGPADDGVELQQALEDVFGASVTSRPSKDSEGWTLTASETIMAEMIHRWVPGGAREKRIPEELMLAPNEVVLELIRGYLEADGWSRSDGERISVCCANEGLLYQFRQLLLSLGCIGTLSGRKTGESIITNKRGKKMVLEAGRDAFYLSVSTRSARRLQQLMDGEEAEVVASGKSGFFFGDYFASRVCSASVVDCQEVISFEVGGDHTFCTPGMATHNSVLLEHIVPLRLIFPQAASGSSDPFTSINLVDWRDQVAAEIARWRYDNNYIPIMPLPLGQQSVGGDGRALLLFNEMQTLAEHIIMGMGVPREFLMGGMCLSQNSMVFTDRGLERLSEIRESGSARRKVVTHEGIGEASQMHQPGRKRVFRVRTRSGLTLDGASTHKLLTLQRDLTEDFTQIGSMSGGEYVAVKVGANLWPTDPSVVTVVLTKVGGRYANQTLEDVTIPQDVTPELARILGYLTSEGSCADPRRMSFSNTDKVLFDDFVYCVRSVFNITLGAHLEEYDTVRSASGKKTIYKTEISRQTVVEFLQGLGLSTDSYGKNVPECIRLSPKNIVVNFLRAYFDGDGGVSTSNGKLCVSAHSVSEELLQEVQLLLLNAGVVSSLYPPSCSKSTYTLQIRSEFGKKYLAEVGFTSPTKTVGELEVETRTAGNCSNTVPFVRDALLAARDRHVHGFGSWRHEPVDAVLSKEEYTVDDVARLLQRDRSSILIYIRKGSLLAEFRNGEQGRFGHYVIKIEDLQHFMRTRGVGKRRTFAVRQYEYSYDTLASSDLGALKTLEPELYSRVKLLQDQAFFWDEVVSVEELELEEEMLDLGVEGSHSYQANGIIGHNSYAGTNVSMRMLENSFLNYVGRHRLMARWVMKMVAHFMGWPEANIRFKPFKMADDLQRKAYLFQLNQAGKVSDQTLLADADLEQEEEDDIMIRETDKRLEATKKQQLAMAEVQGESQVIMMKMQAKAQEAMAAAQQGPQAPGEPGGPEGMMQGGAPPMQGAPAPEGAMAAAQSPLNASQNMGASPEQAAQPGAPMGADLMQLAQGYAQQIAQFPPEQQEQAVNAIAAQSPELAQLVQQILAQMGGGQQAIGVDQRPLPDKLPARRDAQLV